MILYSFGNDAGTSYTVLQVEEYLKQQETVYKGKIGWLQAVVNDNEHKVIGEAFTNRNWHRQVDGWVNPRTSQKLYLYVKSMYTDAPPIKEEIKSTIKKVASIKRIPSSAFGILRKKRALRNDW